MKGKMYILMAIVMVSLCVAGCGKNNEKQESYGKNNEKQKSSSESKEKKVKSVKVSVEDIKAMYKGWTIEEQENGIGFNTFENDERNYLRVYYLLEGDQCRAVRYQVSLNGYNKGHSENIKKLSKLMVTIPMLDAFKFNGVSEQEFKQMEEKEDNRFALSKDNLEIRYGIYDKMEDMPLLSVTVRP